MKQFLFNLLFPPRRVLLRTQPQMTDEEIGIHLRNATERHPVVIAITQLINDQIDTATGALGDFQSMESTHATAAHAGALEYLRLLKLDLQETLQGIRRNEPKPEDEPKS